MTARALPLAAAALFAVLQTTGCTCGAKVGDVRPKHEIAAYKPTAPDAKIDAVSFGTNSKDSIQGAAIGTTLPATAERAIVWYRWTGASDGHRIDIKWYSEPDQTILEQDESLDKPFGDSAWVLKKPDGSPLPAGAYRVELLENGAVVSKIPFTVGP